MIIDEYKQQGMHLPRFLRRREPFKADGATAYKILHLVERLKRNRECIHAVIFIRDLDNQPERWDGLAQARTEFEHRDLAVAIVIGVANSKREAWVLNGFVPCDAAEEERLRSLKQQLSFDPTVDAHRLRERTFQEPDRIRNVKVVLSVLTGDDGEREAMCWQQMSLALLRERGVQTGLSAYMNEVWERMVPIISS